MTGPFARLAPLGKGSPASTLILACSAICNPSLSTSSSFVLQYRLNMRRQQTFPSSRRTQCACAPYSSTPLRQQTLAMTRLLLLPFPLNQQGWPPGLDDFGAQSHGPPQARCVRFAGGILCHSTQHSLLGCWLGFTRRIIRWVRLRGF
jgi:hypothetical protein